MKTYKHEIYHEVLENLQAGKCPLCELGLRAASDYLQSMIQSGVNDNIELRRKLRASRGFCPDHAWLLTEVGDRLPVTILYQDFIREALEEVLAQGKKGKAGFGKKLHAAVVLQRGHQWDAGTEPAYVQPTAPCPACVIKKQTEEHYGGSLLDFLSADEQVRSVYRASPGLCRFHCGQALSLVQDERARELLLEVYIRRLGELKGFCEEYMRKQDYRYSKEPLGEERNAWEQSVRFYVGNEGAQKQ